MILNVDVKIKLSLLFQFWENLLRMYNTSVYAKVSRTTCFLPLRHIIIYPTPPLQIR